tara:strand:- start:16914 stop:17591 length:678 start_codon:yes stop_codon:yes gene_type:complete
MKNIFLISSVIKVTNAPFSYINTRSVYNIQKRFNQTINTINSIKNYDNNAIIILVECSEFTENELKLLKNNVNYFLNCYNNQELKNIILYNKSKSYGAGMQDLEGLKFILNNNIEYENIFKISGRYYLNNFFNYINFMNNEIIVKKINNNPNNIITILFKINKKNIIELINFFQNSNDDFINCLGYEVIFSKFINKQIQNNNNVKYIDNIGVEGYISVSGDFVKV